MQQRCIGGFLCKRILLSSSLAHRIFMHLSFGGNKPAASHWCNLLNGVHSPIWLRMPPTPVHCMHESVWFTPFLSLPTAVPPFTISVSFHLPASHSSCAHCSDTISSYNSPNLSVFLLFSKSSGVFHSASRTVCRWGGGHTHSLVRSSLHLFNVVKITLYWILCHSEMDLLLRSISPQRNISCDSSVAE